MQEPRGQLWNGGFLNLRVRRGGHGRFVPPFSVSLSPLAAHPRTHVHTNDGMLGLDLRRFSWRKSPEPWTSSPSSSSVSCVILCNRRTSFWSADVEISFDGESAPLAGGRRWTFCVRNFASVVAIERAERSTRESISWAEDQASGNIGNSDAFLDSQEIMVSCTNCSARSESHSRFADLNPKPFVLFSTWSRHQKSKLRSPNDFDPA